MYPKLIVNLDKLKANIDACAKITKEDGNCSLMLVTKGVCADEKVCDMIIGHPQVDYMADSRVLNLAKYHDKANAGGKQTVLLRLPMLDEIKDVVRSVRVMDTDGTNLRTVSNEYMQFSYRHSVAEDEGIIILSAEMELANDDPDEIAARVAELQSKRNAKQPVNYPSAGSTFKRPAGGYAAALIEQSGLKGYTVGGAQVSEKHSGFVINTGGASCEDVLAVMRHVRETVLSDSGILLEPEVRLINCSL